MTFKEILKNDVKNIFLNTEEFAEKHIINGQEITAVVCDNELYREFSGGSGNIAVKFPGENLRGGMGIYGGMISIYISAEDFGKPLPGSQLDFDGKLYIVLSSADWGGIRNINMRRVGRR